MNIYMYGIICFLTNDIFVTMDTVVLEFYVYGCCFYLSKL